MGEDVVEDGIAVAGVGAMGDTHVDGVLYGRRRVC